MNFALPEHTVHSQSVNACKQQRPQAANNLGRTVIGVAVTIAIVIHFSAMSSLQSTLSRISVENPGRSVRLVWLLAAMIVVFSSLAYLILPQVLTGLLFALPVSFQAILMISGALTPVLFALTSATSPIQERIAAGHLDEDSKRRCPVCKAPVDIDAINEASIAVSNVHFDTDEDDNLTLGFSILSNALSSE